MSHANIHEVRDSGLFCDANRLERRALVDRLKLRRFRWAWMRNTYQVDESVCRLHVRCVTCTIQCVPKYGAAALRQTAR